MRYYDIAIYQSQEAALSGSPPVTLTTAQGSSTARWTSHPNGAFNPYAQDIEIDLYTGPSGIPFGPPGASFIRLWGPDLITLKNAVQFAGNLGGSTSIQPMWMTVYGGMGKGLPLSNASQSGLLTAGMVWQAYGNWRGTEMTVDFLLNAGGSSYDQPVGMVLNWQQGETLQSALTRTLSVVYPSATLNFQISQNLVATSNQLHYAGTLTELSQFLTDITREMLGPGAIGVQIVPQGNSITIFDGTVASSNVKQLVFNDLVGQPTWQDAFLLWIQTVMRADINVGDTIALPVQLAQTGQYVITQPQSYPAQRDQSIISGNFIVQQVRHTGRFRDPSGLNWVSTFICVPLATFSQQAGTNISTPTGTPGNVTLGQPFVQQ